MFGNNSRHIAGVLAFSALLFWMAPSLFAASIGTAVADGGLRLNRTLVPGNSSLPEGALVETLTGSARVQLTSGSWALLEPHSAATVFANKLVLEKGATEVRPADPFVVEARTLRFALDGKSGQARIRLDGEKSVYFAASLGKFQVRNSFGALVSYAEPGYALALRPQAVGQAAPSSFVGCVIRRDGKHFIFDQTTRLLVELRGGGIAKEWGNRVQVNGTARGGEEGAGARVQILDVTSFTRISEGGCETVAQAAGGQVPPTAPQAPPAAPQPAAPPPPAIEIVPVATGGGGGGLSAGALVGIVAGAGAAAGAGIFLATQGDSRSK